MKTNSTNEIKQLGIQRYEDERLSVRIAAVDNASEGICLELYSGQGIMRHKIYERAYLFTDYITVDTDPLADVRYHMSAMTYLDKRIKDIAGTISLVDFDAYGGPHFEIQEFFEKRKDKDKGIVIVITDGLGLMLKRSVKKARVMERYLLTEDDNIDMRHCWKHMKQMTHIMMTRLAEKHNMRCVPLMAIPGKGQNFLFSAWKFV